MATKPTKPIKSFKKTAAAPTKQPAAKPNTKAEKLRADVKAGKDKAKEPDKTLATRSALPPSAVTMGADSDVQGEVNSSDIKLPYLALVQGVGDLSAIFVPGQLILAGEIELTDAPEKDKPGDQVEVVLVWARKQFLEKLPYGSDEMPRIFDTAQAAAEEGLTTEWINNEPPSAGPMLTCLVLVKQTKKAAETESAYFTLEYDDAKYAPCMWRIKSTAYNRAGKAILTAKALAKTDPLYAQKFVLTSKREKIGQNWVFTPNIRRTGRHDEDFIQFVAANQK